MEHSHDHEHVTGSHEHASAHDHAHDAESADLLAVVGAGASSSPLSAGIGHDGHTYGHAHRHEFRLTSDGRYGRGTAAGIGMLHGVGAETPTQVVVFLAAAAAGGIVTGVLVLLVFLVGLVISNTAITVASAFGFAKLSRRKGVQIAMGAFTAAMSVGIGILFVTGNDGILPAFFAG